MKPALLILAAALLLAGCGHAKDPFVGTWQTSTTVDPGAALVVIAKMHNEYHVALAYSPARGITTLTRHGNQLMGMVRVLGGKRVKVIIEYQPASDHLILQTMSGEPVEPTKLADTTTIPTFPPLPPTPL